MLCLSGEELLSKIWAALIPKEWDLCTAGWVIRRSCRKLISCLPSNTFGAKWWYLLRKQDGYFRRWQRFDTEKWKHIFGNVMFEAHFIF